MLYHHYPSDAKRNVKHVAVTHIEDYIISRDILSLTHNSPDYPFDDSALEILGMTDDDVLYIEANISKVVSSAELIDTLWSAADCFPEYFFDPRFSCF